MRFVILSLEALGIRRLICVIGTLALVMFIFVLKKRGGKGFAYIYSNEASARHFGEGESECSYSRRHCALHTTGSWTKRIGSVHIRCVFATPGGCMMRSLWISPSVILSRVTWHVLLSSRLLFRLQRRLKHVTATGNTPQNKKFSFKSFIHALEF